ncbi:hypothetical protein PVAND_015317 [Polypedilum vanderplanki]|uniref:Uncharacterized protein n=1 Tax=Polypedilum vanderplanki TaxID=319348 RepID=A0A9J6BCP2_POLVA|nr:hypothetical protein PVAND_015317 [Polypedilum vanderplanki]
MTPVFNFPPNVDTGCINNWQPYQNDDAPNKNGIAAGEFDCNNTAFVGKVNVGKYWSPGRIQTIKPTGIYAQTNGSKEVLYTNGSFYLANNPNYSYYWIPYDGSGKAPDNAVKVRSEIGAYALPVARVKIDGKMEIGAVALPVASFPDGKDNYKLYGSFEFLVCDPYPKYQCGQVWKQFNNTSLKIDGFKVGSTNFIGRSCGHKLGRAVDAGVYFIDKLTKSEGFDNSSTASYLVKNSNYNYTWIASTNGHKVPNALEQHSEGHFPFYIGTIRVNSQDFIGKVLPGQGLICIDANGKLKSSSSYFVLTCTSNDVSQGVYQEEIDEDWFNEFWCPEKKVWNYEEEKCQCKRELKIVGRSEKVKWNEKFCRYE